jgi:hypothetical protein
LAGRFAVSTEVEAKSVVKSVGPLAVNVVEAGIAIVVEVAGTISVASRKVMASVEVTAPGEDVTAAGVVTSFAIVPKGALDGVPACVSLPVKET